MNVYKYIAESDPNGAISIINSFGYEVVSSNDLGQSLSELVNQVGEPALKKIMDFHPDKEIILEMYSKDSVSGCNCPSCASSKARANHQEHYMNVSGSEIVAKTNSQSTTLAHQTNVILVVSALFIATALILKK